MNSEVRRIETPLSDATVESLEAGQRVSISGVLYTGRDAAHKRLVECIERGEDLSQWLLPFDLRGQIIYYVGPTPAKPGRVIGSAGPTTAYRMDAYAPVLIARGLKGMIGKGQRSREVIEAMRKHKAVYFGAIGGAAALIARCITSAEIIAYDDLGTEAIRRLVVEDYPAVVINDVRGRDLYDEGRKKYAKT